MFSAYLAKFSLEKRKELSDRYQVIWEDDEQISECRSCTNSFNFYIRKHHCRFCGGIYCGMCANLFGRGGRKCYNCVQGLSPSKDLIDAYKNITKIPFSINQAHTRYIPSIQPDVIYGSLYNSNFERLDQTPAHRSGYFQVTNRSDEMCSIKVVAEGSCNVYHEVFRPPYLAIPPMESVYSITTDLSAVYIFVLFDSSVSLGDGSIVFKAASAERISDCAKVTNFKKFAIYKSKCRGCNVLLKYKGGGILEPRDGQGRRLAYKAAGLFSRVSRSTSLGNTAPDNEAEIEAATLDFRTNVTAVEEVMCM